MTPIQQAATRLVEQHGGLRKAATAIGINFAYLWRLKSGEKSNPNVDVLKALGLVKKVTFSFDERSTASATAAPTRNAKRPRVRSASARNQAPTRA